MLSERLALLVSMDARGAVKGLESVGKAADRELGKAESKLDKAGRRAQKFGVGMMSMAGIAAAGLYQAGKAAADLEQAVGGTEAVFKDTSGVIDGFAKSAAQNMGLSERAFREATTAIGGQLKGLGFSVDEAADQAIDLTKVAADLAATYGGTTAEAVQALGAAFRGEADPAERFNLFLNQGRVNAEAVALGLAESTSSVTANAKAQAVLSLVTKQSADAQGQFARETGTAAGQMAIASAEIENAKAALGESVAPILAAVAGGLADVASGFTKASDATGGLLSKVATLGTIGLGAAGGLSFLAGKAIVLRNSIKDLPGRMKEITGGLSGVKGTMVKAGAAVTAAAVAWGIYKDMMADAAAEGRAAADGIRSAFDDIDPDTMSMEKLRSIIAGMDGDIADMSATLDGSSAPWDADFRAEVKASIGAGTELRGEWKKLETAAGDLADEMGISEDAALRQILTNEDLKGSIDPVTGAFDAEAGAATAAGQALKDLNDELNAMFDPLFAAQDAMLDLADAQAEVTKAEKEHGRNSAEAQAARRDAIRSTMDYESALIDLKAGIEAGSVSVEDATATLNAWAWQGFISKQAADEAAWSFGVLGGKADDLDGKNVVIRATADTAEAESALDRLISRLGTIAGSSVYQRGLGSLYGVYQPDAPPSLTPPPLRTPERAHGGPVTQGSTYMVGERGPELFTAAASGSIIPNNRLGSGGVTNIFYISALDPAAAARAVKDAVRAGSVRGVA